MGIDNRKILGLKTKEKILAMLNKERITYYEGKNTISFDGRVCTFDAKGKLLMIE